MSTELKFILIIVIMLLQFFVFITLYKERRFQIRTIEGRRYRKKYGEFCIESYIENSANYLKDYEWLKMDDTNAENVRLVGKIHLRDYSDSCNWLIGV